jgi:hypothetical protein
VKIVGVLVLYGRQTTELDKRSRSVIAEFKSECAHWWPIFSNLTGGFKMQDQQSSEVVITDIKMRFGSMVIFMVKAAIASIPAFIILAILSAILGGVFGGIISGLF